MIQLENLLTRMQRQSHVIAMGDFNFEPTTEQYTLITQTLADSWLRKWPGEKEVPGLEANQRIDHIFVSPEMTVTAAEYATNPASDHPFMYVIIQSK